jgi:uridine kinase
MNCAASLGISEPNALLAAQMKQKKPYLLGITGGSASGKTRFLRELGERFSREEVCILSQDNYYNPPERHVKDEKGHTNYDLPESIDLDAFAADIERLVKGETVRRKEYMFQNEGVDPQVLEFRPAPIVIVEGLFIFSTPEIARQFDLKVFIDASEHLQLERRLRRDTEERNIPADFVLYQWEYHVMPSFNKYLLPHKQDADMIINNNTHFNNSLKVVEAWFRQLLNDA